MFEKKEDKLFEYAFGDLDAHDAQVFEASLLKDDASAEELKFLQSIKGDLMSFRDIPEMQYSKERLRDAILGQGLKPSRPSLPWLNWVLAPGALACTFALGYVLMNGTSHKEPVLVGSNLGANSSKGVGLVLPKSILNHSGPIVATNTDKGKKAVAKDSLVESSVVRDVEGIRRASTVSFSKSRSKHTNSSTQSLVAMNVAQKMSGVSSGAVAGVASLNGVSNSEPSLDSVNLTPSSVVDATLILIDKDQDSGVGAPVATEVNDTKNVIVGG